MDVQIKRTHRKKKLLGRGHVCTYRLLVRLCSESLPANLSFLRAVLQFLGGGNGASNSISNEWTGSIRVTEYEVSRTALNSGVFLIDLKLSQLVGSFLNIYKC